MARIPAWVKHETRCDPRVLLFDPPDPHMWLELLGRLSGTEAVYSPLDPTTCRPVSEQWFRESRWFQDPAHHRFVLSGNPYPLRLTNAHWNAVGGRMEVVLHVEEFEMQMENKVALAFVDVLDDTLRSSTHEPPSAHFFGARANIARGDVLSVDPNLQSIVAEVESAIEGIWAHPETSDRVRDAFREKLSDATIDEIRAAARLLARFVGGDAATYVRTWHTVPPRQK